MRRETLTGVGLVLVVALTLGLSVYHSQITAAITALKSKESETEKTGASAVAPGQSHAGHAASTGERKILYWQDPMHPAFTSDKPGKAPDCGMDLVPVYAEGGNEEAQMPEGSIRITPQKQQLIGVTYGEAKQQRLVRTIRAVGRLTYDETKIAEIHTKIEGWISKIYVNFVGQLVRKGDPLFAVYSPELVSSQQEYLIAMRARKYLSEAPYAKAAQGANSLLDSTRERLKLWDISEEQIADLERTGQVKRDLTLYAPVDGFVLERKAYENVRITPDVDVYRIADLSTIWANAEVYEYEIPYVKLGQSATMTLSYFPGEIFRGKVTYIYPQLDAMTRTLKVRLEFPNPEFKLKPDMYADINLEVDYGSRIVVPQDAVLDAGAEQVVFVALGDGYFEPRKVELGPRVDDTAVILSGLKAGERIVTSGNFLVDAESRLKTAMAGMAHAGMQMEDKGQKAPATPASPSGKPAGTPPDHSQHQGGTGTGDSGQADHSQHQATKPAIPEEHKH